LKSYKWIYKDRAVDAEVFSRIRDAAGSDLLANLLINRGITDYKKAKEFLHPENSELTSAYVFPDMQKTLERINKALEKQEHIVVYGDFDSDGVTSTSLMYKTLSHIGANVGYYIPDRSDEGHGLNKAAVCRLISSKKAKIILTVDCGISNLSEVKLAQGFGTDVIITDHHEPLEELPDAYSIINPKMLDNDRIRQLAGVGVAFKLAQALLEAHGKADFIEEILPLVAIGTVGDVVPLVEENRLLVYRGLEAINNKKPASIAKLMDIAGHSLEKKITSTILAFTIVPRINAIGRLAEALTAVEFLITDDPAKLAQYAVELERNNRERQQICDDAFNQAEEKINSGEVDLIRDKAIILADSGWHPGIIGLVASRIVEKYHRPALLFSIDGGKNEARCSARSIEGLNLFETLSNFTKYYLQFGGHSLAAGFCASLERIGFDTLKTLILTHINKNLKNEFLQPELKIDLDLNSADVTEELVDELEKLAPYGELNPYPVFSLSGLRLKSFKTMGAKKNHLKILLGNDFDEDFEAVWWQKNCLDVCPMEKVNVAFVPSINHFNGRKILQLILKDLQAVNAENSYEPCICSEEGSGIQWVDRRTETGLKKEFLEYLKSKGDRVSVFVESQRALEIIEKIPFLKPLAVNRLNLKETECLVFLDFPCDDMGFVNIIRETYPSEIHLFGILSEYDPIELVKKVSGMFRYACSEKNGVVDLNKAACTLGVSSELVFSCAQLLDAARVIEIINIRENQLEMRFIGSVNLNSMQEMAAFSGFISSIDELIEFKNEYKVKELDLIKETLDNLEAFQCLP